MHAHRTATKASVEGALFVFVLTIGPLYAVSFPKKIEQIHDRIDRTLKVDGNEK